MATGVVLTKYWGRPVELLAFTAWQMIAGGLFLFPLVLLVEGVPSNLTGANLAGFSWLSTVGTALAYSLWFRGIQRLPVAQVSLLGLLSPAMAATLGWIVLDQALSLGQLVGMSAILSAVWIGQTQPPSPTVVGSNG